MDQLKNGFFFPLWGSLALYSRSKVWMSGGFGVGHVELRSPADHMIAQLVTFFFMPNLRGRGKGRETSEGGGEM